MADSTIFRKIFVLLHSVSISVTMKVIVSQEIERVCPEFVGACVDAQVVNSPYCQELWQEIESIGNRYRSELTTESLKDMTSIAATRRVYKACGKDPSRYRPASEALIRRVLLGKELYQRDTLVACLILPDDRSVGSRGTLLQPM